MIDIESTIFSAIAEKLDAAFSGVFVTGQYVETPSSFPAVSIVEMDNTVYQKMGTTVRENAVQLTYEVNVYSNKVGYGKSECKGILAVIDEAFAALNFSRTLCNPVQNFEDATIYRMVARYEAVADKDYYLYTK